MSYPQTGQDLLNLFGDVAAAGYKDHVFLSDIKVGFSIQRKYPPGIRYKPAKTSAGEDDTVAVIWVVYEDRFEKDGTLVPLRLRISMLSRYRQKHLFDDDEDDAERPTAESLRQSRQTPQPMELSLRGYFFDVSSNSLVDEKHVTVSGVDVLNRLFKAHCDSVHPLRGLPLRSVELMHGVSRGILDVMIDATKWTLHKVFGRSLAESQNKLSFYDGYDLASLGKYPEDSIDFGGLRFSKRLIPLALLLYAIGAWFAFPIEENSYIHHVIQSEVLSSIHVIGMLFVLEEVLPVGLFYFLNGLIHLRKLYFNWRLKNSI